VCAGEQESRGQWTRTTITKKTLASEDGLKRTIFPNQHAVSPLRCVVQPGEVSVYQDLNANGFSFDTIIRDNMLIRLILDPIPLSENVR
jgi:hypothetical protein